MDNVISFTPSELVAFIGTIAGVCAGIMTIVGVICKVVMRLKAPEVEQNNRIKTLEEENKSRKEEIEKRAVFVPPFSYKKKFACQK